MLKLYNVTYYADKNEYRLKGDCFNSYEAMKDYVTELLNKGIKIKAIYNYIGKNIINEVI